MISLHIIIGAQLYASQCCHELRGYCIAKILLNLYPLYIIRFRAKNVSNWHPLEGNRVKEGWQDLISSCLAVFPIFKVWFLPCWTTWLGLMFTVGRLSREPVFKFGCWIFSWQLCLYSLMNLMHFLRVFWNKSKCKRVLSKTSLILKLVSKIW